MFGRPATECIEDATVSVSVNSELKASDVASNTFANRHNSTKEAASGEDVDRAFIVP
jgi:hypothetical protein